MPFTLNFLFMTLTLNLGCFPLVLEAYPLRLSANININLNSKFKLIKYNIYEANNQISALPHIYTYIHTVPKYFSKITSYIQVRLAFHRYSQVIQAYCNRQWFDPPLIINLVSICPWINHLVSGPLYIYFI